MLLQIFQVEIISNPSLYFTQDIAWAFNLLLEVYILIIETERQLYKSLSSRNQWIITIEQDLWSIHKNLESDTAAQRTSINKYVTGNVKYIKRWRPNFVMAFLSQPFFTDMLLGQLHYFLWALDTTRNAFPLHLVFFMRCSDFILNLSIIFLQSVLQYNIKYSNILVSRKYARFWLDY